MRPRLTGDWARLNPSSGPSLAEVALCSSGEGEGGCSRTLLAVANSNAVGNRFAIEQRVEGQALASDIRPLLRWTADPEVDAVDRRKGVEVVAEGVVAIDADSVVFLVADRVQVGETAVFREMNAACVVVICRPLVGGPDVPAVTVVPDIDRAGVAGVETVRPAFGIDRPDPAARVARCGRLPGGRRFDGGGGRGVEGVGAAAGHDRCGSGSGCGEGEMT